MDREHLPTGRDDDVEDVGGMGEHAGASTDELADTPAPTRGSASPHGAGDADDVPAAADTLDDDLVDESGQLQRLDALDPGDSGAPVETLGTGGTHGPGAGAGFTGSTGGEDARVGGLRRRGHAIAKGEEQPAEGGPGAGLADDPMSGGSEPSERPPP